MWCMKCNNELSECICPDIEKRLNSLRGSKYLHIPTIVERPLSEIAVKRDEKKNGKERIC